MPETPVNKRLKYTDLGLTREQSDLIVANIDASQFFETLINEQDKMIKNLQSTKRQIETDLKKQIKSHQIKLEEMEGKLKVTFIDKILFDSGSVRINKNGQALLLTLAESLRDNHRQNIIIQGHTDSVEIGPELRKFYPTNWELSATRSTTVLRYLIESAGIAPERCVASAYSYYKPVASNQSGAQTKPPDRNHPGSAALMVIESF